jgi:LysR family transcriptional regulator, nitrogen assimilation regulatory protein
MNLKQLMYFQSVATHGCITAAAARANVAQSALSSQIAALEADLGVKLLVRHSRGVTLTRSGEVLLERARTISSFLEQARRDVRDAADVTGEITIGIPVSMASVLTLPLLQALEQKLPRAEVHVFEGLTGDLRGWLRSGKIETGILYGNDQADGLCLTPLAEDELVSFGEAGATASGGSTISFSALAQSPIYTTDGDHPVRPLLDRLAKEYGVSLKFGAQINSVSQLKALAREGRGQTILPRVALAAELADADCQIRSIEPAVKLRSYVATTQNPGNRIREVQQILQDVVERLVRIGDWPGAVLLR